MHLRAATRGSELALWQARRVAGLITAATADCTVELVVVSTSGDRDQTSPISAIGGRGVFAKEVQSAVLDGRADFAVHSAKDLTSTPPDGLDIAAYPDRGDVRDALVGASLDELAPGDVVATGSVRRRCQLAHIRPDLRFVELRGNMATRVARVGKDGVAAIVAAAAGLDRLGWSHLIAEHLGVDVMMPQVAQGSLAVEIRADDEATRQAVAAVDDPGVRPLVEAERAWLRLLGSGCELPVGGLAVWNGDEIELSVVLCSLDGSTVLRHTATAHDPLEVASLAGSTVLDDMGGRDLLRP